MVGLELDAQSPRRGSGRAGPRHVANGVIVDRGFQPQRRRLAGARSGPHQHLDAIVIERERADRRAVRPRRVFERPSFRIGRPHEARVVAHDVARYLPQAAVMGLLGEPPDRLEGIAGVLRLGIVGHDARGEVRIGAADQQLDRLFDLACP